MRGEAQGQQQAGRQRHRLPQAVVAAWRVAGSAGGLGFGRRPRPGVHAAFGDAGDDLSRRCEFVVDGHDHAAAEHVELQIQHARLPLQHAAQRQHLVGAIELEPIAGSPTKRAFQAFVKAYEKGALIRTTGDIIALSPPLIITKGQINELIDHVRDVLRAVD